jgi:hypothetical protein
MATDGRTEDVDTSSNPECRRRIVNGGEGGGITEIACRYCTNLGAHDCSLAQRETVPDLK